MLALASLLFSALLCSSLLFSSLFFSCLSLADQGFNFLVRQVSGVQQGSGSNSLHGEAAYDGQSAQAGGGPHLILIGGICTQLDGQ